MFEFKSKANNLKQLINISSNFKVLWPLIFTVDDWYNNSNYLLYKIKKTFKNKRVAIRSSSVFEDIDKSNAGKYRSVLNVNANNVEDICKAIETVIDSYIKNDIHINNNEIFVQEMVENVKCNGVALTYDIEHSRPYYIINMDQSEKTDTITGGKAKRIKTIKMLRNSREYIYSEYRKIFEFILELERIVNYNFLDVEFAVDMNGTIYLLQVRKLYCKTIQTEKLTQKIRKKLNSESRNIFNNSNSVSGTIEIYSNMTDWNPAELVGKHPNMLAYSLYERIFTKDSWMSSRATLGYKQVLEPNLTVLFAGFPFVDVRKDFNSYLPKGLDRELETKIIDFCVEKILYDCSLHDKAEFFAIDTCYTLNFNKSDIVNVLSKNEYEYYKQKLISLTNNIINDSNHVIKNSIKEYNSLQKEICSFHDVDGMQNLLAYAEKMAFYYGIIVRVAFVCYKQFLDLKYSDLISDHELSSFINSFNTISSQYVSDCNKLLNKSISIELFLQKYGYMRPNMFDITSVTLTKLFETNQLQIKEYSQRPKVWLGFKNQNTINNRFYEEGLSFSLFDLQSLTREMFVLREQIKSDISKLINRIFVCIIDNINTHGLTLDELSYIDIGSLDNCKSIIELKSIINKNKYKYKLESKIVLPDLIKKKSDIFCFEEVVSKPTFITDNTIEGIVVDISKKTNECLDLSDKIVVIKNADPGYDWIFGCNIKGFVTEYGGIASHMALRANELNIPAVLGCGSEMIEKIFCFSNISIDCKNNSIISKSGELIY